MLSRVFGMVFFVDDSFVDDCSDHTVQTAISEGVFFLGSVACAVAYQIDYNGGRRCGQEGKERKKT